MREMKDSGTLWIGKIPKEWEIAQVRYLFKIGRGRVIAKTELKDDGKYPVFSSQTKNNGCLGYINSYDFDVEQLTWTTDGANAGTIFLRKGKHNCTNVCGTLQPLIKSINLNYQKFALEHIAFYHKRIDTNGYKIMNNEMASIHTLLPPYEEQQKISEYLDTKCAKIDSIIEKQEKVIEKLKDYKLSVITEAVTKGLNPDVKLKDSGVPWIGDIPEHWEYAKLNNICTFNNGDRSSNYPSPGDFVDKGIPFIGADSLNNHLVDVSMCKYITYSKYNDMSGLKIEKNDILYTLRGSTIGKNALCNFNNGTVASSLMGIRISLKNKCFSNFLSYWLNSDNEYLQRDICINGSTAPNLSAENVKSFIIFLPPIEEQHQIVDYLDKKCSAIDSAIEKKQAIIEKLKEYKKSLIYEVVTGKREV